MRLHLGDCLDLLTSLPDDSIDSVVTDPPYGLSAPPDISAVLGAWMRGEEHAAKGGGFMGAKWDRFVPGPRVWREVLRVLKPGGHAVVFAGTRTVDLMGVSCRLAGFEVRDMGRWVYYNGFPKGTDIGKGIDKFKGAEREVVGRRRTSRGDGAVMNQNTTGLNAAEIVYTAPATPEAEQWSGWKTGLKPSGEPWLLLRKPLREKTIVRQVLATGTGGINIDGCRYPRGDRAWVGPQDKDDLSRDGQAFSRDGNQYAPGELPADYVKSGNPTQGRYPANLYASKKASKRERERGCDSLKLIDSSELVNRAPDSAGIQNPMAGAGRTSPRRNKHPTVKPAEIMRWLCRLVTPPGGTVLDPFVGSGTTGIAATLEGFEFVGAELSEDFHAIATARIEHATAHPDAWADTAPGSRIKKI